MQKKMEWEYLTVGSSHAVFCDKEKKLVFKVLIDNNERLPYEGAERSVRIWNEINQNIDPPAREATNQSLPEEYALHNPADGWIIPYIEGRQATDEEIKALVLDVYNTTGRILVDATTMGNCLTLANHRCVCVDIDLALKLDKQEDEVLSNPLPKTSFSSLETWNSFQQKIPEYHGLAEKERLFPSACKLIKALIFIKSIRPDIDNANFLNGSTELNLLACAYDESMNARHSKVITNLAQDLLEQERPAHLSNLKSTCSDIVTQQLKLGEKPGPGWQSMPEDIKIICQNLIQDIHDAATFDELIRCIEEKRALQVIKTSYPSLNIALSKCLLASDSLYYVSNRKSLANIAVFFSKYTYSRPNLLSMMFIHTLDLASISSKIVLPIFFLEIFNQNPDIDQFSILVVMILLLPVLAELKNKLLVDISADVVEKFTMDLLAVVFNPKVNSVERFTKSFTTEYVDHISLFIKQTYGKLIPAYIDLLGFNIAIGFKDRLVGGVSAGAVFLYLAYTFYFLNPRYANSFKSNLAENQMLYDQLRTSIGRRDLVKFHERVEDEKDAIIRVLKSVLPTAKNKSYYDSQTKILGVLTGNVTFLVGAIYWASTYQQSEKSLTDYILLFYYLYMLTMRLNQLSPLLSQLLSSSEYAKRLIQYSMWSEGKAQSEYKEKHSQNLMPQQGQQQENNTSLGWDLKSITFSNVWYKSHNAKQILNNLSFSINKTDFFAFVGEELGEQLALVRLLRREATPLSGKISFLPLDINTLEDQALYRFLTVIDSKDEFIYGLSWFDTIKYGHKTASDADVLEAATEAGLIEPNENISALKTRFVSMDEDIDQTSSTRVEKRRLAIARAILKGGLCLILDNPTKDLAYHDEISILKTLIKLSGQLITIMVTDKLYLLDHYVNRVFFLKGGIVEQGTYAELTGNHHTCFYKTLLQQRQHLNALCSPPEKFSTVMDVQKSIIERNFRPVGYYQDQSGQQLENDRGEEKSSLIGERVDRYWQVEQIP